MLIAVASVKGSPGATSLAVGLAVCWPTPGAVLVEADPAGGDLAFRFGCRRDPGPAELATDTRMGSRVPDLGAYTRRLPLGVDVVFAPPDQKTSTSTDLGGPGCGDVYGESVQVVRLVARNCVPLFRRAATDRLVVIDVGRLGWDSPALPLEAAADVLLLVSGCGRDAVDAVRVRRDRLLGLTAPTASVRLVLAGKPSGSPLQIAAAAGLPLSGALPDDRRAAAIPTGLRRPGRGRTRLDYLRATQAVALDVRAHHQRRAQARYDASLKALLGDRFEPSTGRRTP